MAKSCGRDGDRGPPWWNSVRYRIAFIVFLGVANSYMQRSNLSMAMVCMVNHTAVDLLNERETPLPSLRTTFYNETVNYTSSKSDHSSNFSIGRDSGSNCENSEALINLNGEDGEFVWSKDIQGLVLGALYWGYVGSQLFGGHLISLYGVSRTVGPCMVVMSVLTLLSHVAAVVSPWLLFAVRLLIGVGNGVFIPGIFYVLQTWAPVEEKSRLTSFIFSGIMMSNIIVFPTSALLCDYGFAGGWPSIFYISGSCSLLWCVAWFWWVYDSPLKHPSIHPKERDYIMSNKATNKSAQSPQESDSVPWCKALTSLPYISLVLAAFSFNWGFYLMLNTLPFYMREVLKFEIKANGVFTMLPYISMWVVMSSSGYIADRLVKRFGQCFVRKLASVLAIFVPAMLMIGISYLDCNSIPLAVSLLCLSLSLMALNYVGVVVNFMDIAPKYAGKLMTVGNSVAMLAGIITPYVVAVFTKNKTREQWQQVFFLSAGVMAAGCLLFLIFGKGSVQKWALDDRDVDVMTIEETEQLNKINEPKNGLSTD